MARTGSYPIYDRMLDGQLGSTLRTWKAADVPVEEMTFRLRTAFDITVSVSTVHRWLATAAADSEQAAS